MATDLAANFSSRTVRNASEAARRWSAWRLVILGCAISGCAAGLGELRPNQPIPPRGVALIGRASFDPPIIQGPAPHGIFLVDGVKKVYLGFSYRPDGDPDDFDETLEGDPGVPFGGLVPRRPMYLRFLRFYKEINRVGRGKYEYVMTSCRTLMKIDIRPSDERLYIGHFVCHHHDGAPMQVVVHDDFASLASWKKILVGSPPVSPRIAVDLAAERP